VKKLILAAIVSFFGACSERDMEIVAAFAEGASAAGGGYTASLPNYNAPMRTGTAFLKNEYTQGNDKVCVYERMGSVHTSVISSTLFCPFTKKIYF
jgi:hypothetical protein